MQRIQAVRLGSEFDALVAKFGWEAMGIPPKTEGSLGRRIIQAVRLGSEFDALVAKFGWEAMGVFRRKRIGCLIRRMK